MDDIGKHLPLLLVREILRWKAVQCLRRDARIEESMLDMTGMQNRLTAIAFAVRVTEMKPQQTSSKHCFGFVREYLPALVPD